MPHRLVLALLSLVLVACCPQAPAVTPAQQASEPPVAATAPPVVAAGPALDITLTPQLEPRSLQVRVQATGDAAALAQWRIEVASEAPLSVQAHDDEGPLGVRTQADRNGMRLSMDRAVVGALELRYRLRAAADVDAARELAVAVDPERMRLSGESALALPLAFDRRGVAVKLSIVSAALRGQGAASSFGVGAERSFKALGSELRQASYIAGAMGTAILDSREGHDEAAWLGFTTFDPRQAIGDFASFRTAVGNELGQRDAAPFTLLLVTDSRPEGQMDVVGRSASVLASFGVGQPFSGGLRIAIATAIVQRWIGRLLWIGPSGPERQAQAYWFSEGVARFVARELMMRFGLITPSEYATEVNGLLSVLATSKLTDKSNLELAAALEQGSLPMVVARGALYATAVDHALRGKKHTLIALLAELMKKAVAARGPLTTQAWIDAIDAKLTSQDAAKRMKAWIEQGTTRELPTAALGPCFRGKPHRYRTYALGFTESMSRDAVRTVASVDPAGPAAKAGLLVGDVLVRLRHRAGRVDHDVDATVLRAGKERQLRYKPLGPSHKGQAFARVESVDDVACIR